jgi:hypothetical protein
MNGLRNELHSRPTMDGIVSHSPYFAGLYTNTRTTLQDGHIARRFAFKQAESKEDMEKELGKQQEAALAEAEKRRVAITVPTEPAELVDLFFTCHAEDMEYFVAKARPRLGSSFFAAVDAAIGEQRFLDDPDEDRIAELEGLRAFVTQTLAAQASVTQGLPAFF